MNDENKPHEASFDSSKSTELVTRIATLEAMVAVLQARAERCDREHVSIIERAFKPNVSREDFDLTMGSIDERIATLAAAKDARAFEIVPDILAQIGLAMRAMTDTMRSLTGNAATQGEHLHETIKAVNLLGERVADMQRRLSSIEAGLVQQGWRRVA